MQAKAAAPRGELRKRRRSRREELIDLAARHFNARGVSAGSLSDIAERLGVSRNALYYYIKDKEDLVFQTYHRSAELLLGHLKAQVAEGGTALDIVRRFISAALAEDQPELAACSEMGILRPDDRAAVVALRDQVVALLTKVVRGGVEARTLRSCDPDIAARAILSMIEWAPLASRWTISATPVERHVFLDTLNDLVSRGWATARDEAVEPVAFDLSRFGAAAPVQLDREALTEAKREAILIAASRLFNRKGLDASTLDEISAELGLTKGALYHYVGDKPAIVLACYRRTYALQRHISELAQEIADPVARWCATGRTFAIAQMRPDVQPLGPSAGLEGLPEDVHAALMAESRSLYASARAQFEALQEAGRARPVDPNLMMLILPGPWRWLDKEQVPADDRERLRISEEISSFCRVGLAPA